MEVAGYVRVSTEQQKEDNSHERQADRLRGWAERNGAEIEIFQDTAISGKDPNRESYQKLMGDPSEDELGIVTEYDALVVREMSRFGRSLQQVRLDEHDTDFISLKEDIDMSSAQGKLMMHIIAAFNQFWSDWSRERALEYAERAREDDDLQLGRPTKLGPEQIEQVREWHDMGLGYASIVPLVEDAYGVEVSDTTIYRYCQDA
jgi:DNA invertase Pin-like site-specific DNA recombinase